MVAFLVCCQLSEFASLFVGTMPLSHMLQQASHHLNLCSFICEWVCYMGRDNGAVTEDVTLSCVEGWWLFFLMLWALGCIIRSWFTMLFPRAFCRQCLLSRHCSLSTKPSDVVFFSCWDVKAMKEWKCFLIALLQCFGCFFLYQKVFDHTLP